MTKGKPLFEMSQKEFDNFMNSKEGIEFLNGFLDCLDKTIKEDPYFHCKECWNLSCKFNSDTVVEPLEMGAIPFCTKFSKDEKNDCEERDTDSFYER